MIGNSFSTAFAHAFDRLVSRDHCAVTITSSWGASPVREIPSRGAWDKANNCYWSKTVLSLAGELRKGDWIFLISDVADYPPKEQSDESRKTLATLKDGLQRLATDFSGSGIRVAVLHGNPFAREANCKPLNAVKQWFQISSNECSLPDRSESLLRRKPLDDILLQLEGQDCIRVVDLFSVFCPCDECTCSAANGSILCRGEFSHPSVEAAKSASDALRKVLAVRRHG